MSRSHANRGEALEALLDLVHAGYHRRGVAFVLRLPAPMKILRSLPPKRTRSGKPSAPQFVACYETTGAPDYLAVVNGRAFLFDAKQHEGSRLPFNAIPPQQAEAFDRHEAQGGTAGLVIVLDGQGWWAPWSAVGPRWWEHAGKVGRAAPGTASLSVDDLDALGRRIRTGDWLAAALSLGATTP
jgi:penicillin-binding protein-related factor A (putative recombinase)